jgi:hypothetical protein
MDGWLRRTGDERVIFSLDETRQAERRDVHALDADGMVACNPRDRAAAHRARVESIATTSDAAVTCRKCLEIIRRR